MKAALPSCRLSPKRAPSPPWLQLGVMGMVSPISLELREQEAMGLCALQSEHESLERHFSS